MTRNARPVALPGLLRCRLPATLLLTAALHWPGTAAGAETTEYLFEVSYDDRPIGTHSFVVSHDANIKRVLSRADFEVRLMFVTLYRYRHEAEELWQDGCLERLDSRTDDNGRRFEIAVREDAGALRIDRRAPEPASERLTEGCAGTFAYWDLGQLERTALLNSQTGALTRVALRADGADPFQDEPAVRYRLEPAGLEPIILWYRASDRRWLGLETRRGDAVIRYRPIRDRSEDGGPPTPRAL
jgi:hypothetical protein